MGTILVRKKKETVNIRQRKGTLRGNEADQTKGERKGQQGENLEGVPLDRREKTKRDAEKKRV